MSDFLRLSGKTFVVLGVANRKSVAYHIGKTLEEVGAHVIYVVRSEERKESVVKLLKGGDVYVCDVEFPEQIEQLRSELATKHSVVHGLVHSIAFAEYDGGMKPFHETGKAQFLRAVDISCYSLIAISNAFKDLLDPDGSVVAISISTTRMASENYGYMGADQSGFGLGIGFPG